MSENDEKCEVISKHIQPLLDCCKQYEAGEIQDSTFFATALIRTGEFMQEVQKRNAVEPVPVKPVTTE